MTRIAFLIFTLTALLHIPNAVAARLGDSTNASNSFQIPDQIKTLWTTFEGKTVNKISFKGLERTRESAARWLLTTHETEAFSTDILLQDLQRLYNTGNLYDLTAHLSANKQTDVDVEIILKDKWTLLPVFGAQGGGGSSTIGGGVYESNLLGYMINSSALIWQFNGTNSYDIFLNQEYFHGSSYMWSVDIQDSISPETLTYYNGATAGKFAWRRQQKELMIGTHFDGPMRLQFFTTLFQDSVFTNDANFNVVTLSGLQQRFYPKVIFGKVNGSDYLEYGTELTLIPVIANVIGNNPQYASLELDFKHVFITGEKQRDNIAFFLSASTMGNGGPNYAYDIGGYANLRGYADMREFGRRMFYSNLEYRPYLMSARVQLLDVDLVAVQGCLFSDVGSAWGDSSLTGEAAADAFRPLWSGGAGVRVNFVKFAGAILRLDFARTISPDEGFGISFGIGQFF